MQQESIIKIIADKLKKYPNIRFENNSEHELTIFSDSDNGFDITLYTDEQENTLFFGGFHWHFELTEKSTDAMLGQLLYGLTGMVRLKEFSKKSTPYKYILQVQNEEGQWIDSETTGLLFFNYLAKSSIRYLQNHLLPRTFIFHDSKT